MKRPCIFFNKYGFLFKLDEYNEEVQNIYWKCEQKCRKHTLRFGYFVITHTSTFTIGLVYALVCIAFEDYNTASWYLPFFMLVPFDQTRILSWMLMWLFQFNIAMGYALVTTSVTSYFVSCCYYIHSMCDHFKLLINSVTNGIEHMQMEKNRWEIMKIYQQTEIQLRNIVNFHMKIKE